MPEPPPRDTARCTTQARMGREVDVEYSQDFESWPNRLTEAKATKHRPFSELTKDPPPEPKTHVAAMTTQLLDELQTEKREPRRSQPPRKESRALRLDRNSRTAPMRSLGVLRLS